MAFFLLYFPSEKKLAFLGGFAYLLSELSGTKPLGGFQHVGINSPTFYENPAKAG